MSLPPLPHSVFRAVTIPVRAPVLFGFLTDSARFASWFGDGSSIDPRPGGVLRVRYPNGVIASGAVLEVDPPHRLAFTYGYEDPAKPIAPGASRVTLTVDEVPVGTHLSVRHEVATASARDEHDGGWRFQLSLLANLAAAEGHAAAAETIDRFFAAWSDADPRSRRGAITEIVTPEVRFRDRFAAIEGADDLLSHIGAVQTFLPGMRLARLGDVRHCQGTLLVAWQAVGADGGPRGAGTNVFTLDPDGRIAACVGFWNP